MKKPTARPKKKIGIRSTIGAAGRVRCQVIAADGSIRDHGWTNNLILDSGIDYFEPAGTSGTANLISHLDEAYAGTGTTPTKRLLDGTFNQSGTTLTRASGTGVFAAGDVGRMVKYGGGDQARITAFTNTTTVTVDRTHSVSGETCTIHEVDQKYLATHSRTTGTESGVEGDNDPIYDAGTGTCTIQKTWIFGVESGAKNYTEVGIGKANQENSGSGGDLGLFSRIVLDSPVAVAIGEQLKLTYQLSFTETGPRTQEEQVIDITGWPRPYNVVSITSGGTNFTATLDEEHHYLAGGKINFIGVVPVKFAITGITSTPTDFTVTTDSAHGLSASDSFEIEDTASEDYNGTWTVASSTSTTITVTSAADPGTLGAGGTARLSTPSPWYDDQEWTIDSVDGADVTIASAIDPVDAGATGTAQSNLKAQVQHMRYPVVAGSGDSTDYNAFYDSYDTDDIWMKLLRVGDAIEANDTFPRSVVGINTFTLDETEIRGTLVWDAGTTTATFSIPIDECIYDDIAGLAFCAGGSVSNSIRIGMLVEFQEPQRKDDGYTLVIELVRTIEQALV